MLVAKCYHVAAYNWARLREKRKPICFGIPGRSLMSIESRQSGSTKSSVPTALLINRTKSISSEILPAGKRLSNSWPDKRLHILQRLRLLFYACHRGRLRRTPKLCCAKDQTVGLASAIFLHFSVLRLWSASANTHFRKCC